MYLLERMRLALGGHRFAPEMKSVADPVWYKEMKLIGFHKLGMDTEYLSSHPTDGIAWPRG